MDKKVSFSFGDIQPKAEELIEIVEFLKGINWDNLQQDSVLWFESASKTAFYNFKVYKCISDPNEILLTAF